MVRLACGYFQYSVRKSEILLARYSSNPTLPFLRFKFDKAVNLHKVNYMKFILCLRSYVTPKRK